MQRRSSTGHTIGTVGEGHFQLLRPFGSRHARRRSAPDKLSWSYYQSCPTQSLSYPHTLKSAQTAILIPVRSITVDTPSLEAWLGSDAYELVAGARVAVIGCGRLGRDVVRCLLLTGACTEPRGRMVFIDHGDATLETPDSFRRKGRSHTGQWLDLY